MSINLLSVFVVIAAALPAVAETTTEENPAGRSSWDQPLKGGSPIANMEIPGEERTIDRNVPPAKMVATPQGERTIDRNVPPAKMVATPQGERTIDRNVPPAKMVAMPQGERTINHPVPPVVKMQIPGEAKTPDMTIPPVVKVDPSGVGPARKDLEDGIFRSVDQGPPVKAHNPPIIKREAGEGWEFGQEYPPQPGQPIGLPPYIQKLTSAFQVLNTDIEIYEVKPGLIAFMGSLGIMTYQLLGLGGRQKAVAAVVPPQVFMEMMGRKGYRVPTHAVYSAEAAIIIAEELSQYSGSVLELAIAEIEASDPGLLEYVLEVADAIRMAKAIEYAKFCPNPEECA